MSDRDRERRCVSFRHVLLNNNELSCTKVSPRLRAIVPAANLCYIRRGKFVLASFILYLIFLDDACSFK